MKVKVLSRAECIKKNPSMVKVPDAIFEKEWDVICHIPPDDTLPGFEVPGYYVIEGAYAIPENCALKIEEDKPNSISIARLPNGVRLEKHGSIIELSHSEFWQVVNFGISLDTKGEVEEYIEQLDEGAVIKDVPLKDILANYSVDDIAAEVIESRVSSENGDQIYDALTVLGIKLARKWSDEYQTKMS